MVSGAEGSAVAVACAVLGAWLPALLIAVLAAVVLFAVLDVVLVALSCAVLVALPVALLFPFPMAESLASLFAEQSAGLTPGSIERYIIAPVILADLIMIPPAEVRVPAPPPVSVPSAASVPSPASVPFTPAFPLPMLLPFPFPSAFPLPMPSPMTLPFPSPPSFPLPMLLPFPFPSAFPFPPMIPPSRLLSPNEAVMYLALNRVSQAMKPVESLHGLLSRIATSLSTTALNGFALNPPTTILPSIFPSSEANAFLTSLVCTAGDCTAIRTAVNAVRMAVTVR